jgi:hypothetical protein
MAPALSCRTTTDFSSVLQLRPAKVLARITGRSFRTVEGWRRGESEPRATDIMRLMAADAEIFAAIAAAAGRSSEGQQALAAEHLRKALAALGEK